MHLKSFNFYYQFIAFEYTNQYFTDIPIVKINNNIISVINNNIVLFKIYLYSKITVIKFKVRQNLANRSCLKINLNYQALKVTVEVAKQGERSKCDSSMSKIYYKQGCHVENFREMSAQQRYILKALLKTICGRIFNS